MSSLLLPSPPELKTPWGVQDATFTPWTDPNTLFYWDPDDAAAATLSVITDKMGSHDLSQASPGKRATNTDAQFGTHRGLVFPAAASHGGYLWDTPWTKPSAATVYQIYKYVSNGTHQALVVGDAFAGANVGPVMRLSGAGAELDKPFLVSGSRSLAAASAVSGGTIHLVKYGWKFSANKMYLSIDGGAALSSALDSASAGTFNEWGLSSLNVHDLVSILGIQAIATGWHDGDAYDTDMTDYLMAWAGI